MSQRILRVNQLIKKEISQIILKEVDFPKGTLATVTRVETSSNLIEAKVYISVMPESKAELVLQILTRLIYFLQQQINKRLKMRPVPQIKFFEEIKTKEAAEIEKLLEEIKKEK